MRLAIAALNNRVAPVFDTARRLIIICDDTTDFWDEVALQDKNHVQRTVYLVEAGIDVLICGAVSQALSRMIQGHGIEVHSFVSGDLADVLEAYKAGRLDTPAFAMPGCRGMRHRQTGPRSGQAGYCCKGRGRGPGRPPGNRS